mmetsp:Transcript_27671/g.52121  ORF Transcript_27671/g.52121 Transcript_27671/m.52121 type:complete len:321 (-) Transcript_27671:54-1016(-)
MEEPLLPIEEKMDEEEAQKQPTPSAPPEVELDDVIDVEQQHLYPDSFYCPLTKKVMEDPVVGPDGDSFEKSAVLERDAAADSTLRKQPTYYPNRALQIIIEKEKKHTTDKGTMLGVLQRAEESLRAGMHQIREKSALPTGGYRPLPDAYYCSITLDLMSRPTVDPDGNTYERDAILGWVRANGDSPLTRKKLDAGELRDNNALLDLIDDEVNKGEGSIHPSFRRLRESRIEVNEAADVESGGLTDGALSGGGDSGGSPYPTSQAEIDERLSERRSWLLNFSAILFTFAFFGLSVLVLPLEIVLLLGGVLLYLCFYRGPEG